MEDDRTLIFLSAIIGIGFLAYLIHMKDHKAPGIAGLTKEDLVSAFKTANTTSALSTYGYKHPEGSDF